MVLNVTYHPEIQLRELIIYQYGLYILGSIVLSVRNINQMIIFLKEVLRNLKSYHLILEEKRSYQIARARNKKRLKMTILMHNGKDQWGKY